MAYDKSNLTLLAHGNGFNLWRYDTLDADSVVDGAGYFTGEAVDMLAVGDLVLRMTWATAVRTGSLSTMGWHVVNANDGTTVDVTNTTALTVTDSD